MRSLLQLSSKPRGPCAAMCTRCVTQPLCAFHVWALTTEGCARIRGFQKRMVPSVLPTKLSAAPHATWHVTVLPSSRTDARRDSEIGGRTAGAAIAMTGAQFARQKQGELPAIQKLSMDRRLGGPGTCRDAGAQDRRPRFEQLLVGLFLE